VLIDLKKRRGKNPVTVLSNGFEEDLRRQGYSPSTVWKHRKLLSDLSGWLQFRQLTMGDLSMAQVDRFLSDRRSCGACFA
jgi:integrase/recombinase XerD